MTSDWTITGIAFGVARVGTSRGRMVLSGFVEVRAEASTGEEVTLAEPMTYELLVEAREQIERVIEALGRVGEAVH